MKQTIDKTSFESNIRQGSRVVASKGQISADLAGEAAILNVETGMYFSLNPVGARIWELIQKPATVEQIRDGIVSEYEVSSEQAEKDIAILLSNMAEHGLVEFENEGVD
jgi:hypothetical protein